MLSKAPKVVIVGAGVAGISAAVRLIDKGINNVTILEAENRVGGRINSLEVDGKFIDMGAQWCHGEEDNIVYAMTKDLNILRASINNYMDNTYYLSNGTVIDKSVTDAIFQIAMSIYKDEQSAKVYKGTFGEFFTQEYCEKLRQHFGNDGEVEKISNIMLDWLHKFVRCIDAAPTWHDLAPMSPHYYIECEGDSQLNWADKGYKTIIDILTRKIPDPRKQIPIEKYVRLNKEVDRIKWDQGVQVKCTDGSIYDADHAIVTMSVGCLKEFRKNFEPPLPQRKTDAIEHMKLGKVNKIFVKFERKWWPDDTKGFSFVWDDTHRRNLLSDFPRGPSHNGRSWLEDVVGFYVIDSHPRILLGWVVGPLVEQVELLEEQVVSDGCMFLLKKFAGRKYDISEPEAVYRSKWNTNPHFCGCWSYIDIEAEKRNIFPLDLASPLEDNTGNQVLLFAGEATHPRYFSAVHGAIETGHREAERILSMYKQPLVPHLDHYKVAIVGAGMAGLAAATTLINHANIKDVAVLEAQPRPGGRIHTIEGSHPETFFEMGAQWLHGKENPLYELARRNHLLSAVTTEEGLGRYLTDTGEQIDADVVKLVDFEVGKILGECEQFVNSTEQYPKSVEEFLRRKFQLYLARCEDDTPRVKALKEDLLDWHVRFQIIDNSCKSLGNLSAKHWGQYECLEDRAHFNLNAPFSKLIDILMQQLPQNTVLLATPVNVIKSGKNGVELLCQNGRTIKCDHVIVTCSLGVLKSDYLRFIPSLPSPAVESIKRLGFHGIGKIYLVFDEKWWDCEGFQFVWRRDSQGTKLRDAEEWTRSITGFDAVLNQPKVLLGWVGGNSVEIMEGLSEQVVGIHCVNLLKKFISDREIPNPRQVIRTKWMSNPWIRGAYSHITPDCDSSDNHSGMHQLSQPLLIDGIPRILFAGEAVHPKHYSTAHGAYESGQGQAEILASFIKNRAKL